MLTGYMQVDGVLSGGFQRDRMISAKHWRHRSKVCSCSWRARRTLPTSRSAAQRPLSGAKVIMWSLPNVR